jgi:hypothetical protein
VIIHGKRNTTATRTKKKDMGERVKGFWKAQTEPPHWYVPSMEGKRFPEPAQIRHSFDIRRDQLLSLNQLQAAILAETGRKPKLGTLVQEALDLFFRERSNVRTDERTEESEA